MSVENCYEPNCVYESEFSCDCTDPSTFSCKKHLIQHCQSSVTPHNLDLLFLKPIESTKAAMCDYLKEQKSKTDAMKTKILTLFSQTIHNFVDAFKLILKEIESDSIKLDGHFDKVRKTEKIPKLEYNIVLNLLSLQPHQAVGGAKVMLTKDYDLELLNKMKNLINQSISKFNEEKYKLTEKDLEKLKNNIEEALSSHKEAIRTDPNNSSAYDSIGSILYNEKKYEEAIKYYNAAIRINPNCSLYYKNKGEALRLLGQREKAIKYLQHAIIIDPNQADAYNSMGAIFYNEKRYEEAIKYYNDAIKINPNSSIYYYNKGEALHLSDKIWDAMTCFQKATTIDPNFADAYNSMGVIFSYEDVCSEWAIKCYDDAIRINPNCAVYYTNKGNMIGDLSREESMECHQKALIIDPNHADAYNGIGKIFCAENKHQEALKHYDAVIRIDPNNLLYKLNKQLALDCLDRIARNTLIELELHHKLLIIKIIHLILYNLIKI